MDDLKNRNNPPPHTPPPETRATTPATTNLQHYIDGRVEEIRRKPKPKPARTRRTARHSRQREKEDAHEIRKMQEELAQATEGETWFRHTHWEHKRKLVRAALLKAAISSRTLERFDNCGCGAMIHYHHETKKYKVQATYCHNRHCEPCARAKANLMAANLRERLAETPNGRYRFITLTLKHSDTPLREQIDRLYAAFKKLRTQKLWKETQHGGCSILEVKWDPDTALWHPHLHIVAEGGFIQQNELSAAWLEITGDSRIVDIRALKNERDAAHYVAKYISKGTNNEVWYNEGATEEWIAATQGLRTATTFGKWRGFKLLQKPKTESGWVPVISLQGMMNAARKGDERAMAIMAQLIAETQYNPHKSREKAKKND